MSADRVGEDSGFGLAKTQLSRLVRLAEAGEKIVITRAGKPIANIAPTTTASSPRTFFDTNILIYADDKGEPEKQKIAVALIDTHMKERTGAVSLQVLQEYFVNATRKLKLDAGVARNKVEIYSKFRVGDPLVADILAAIDMHRLHGFSYWDSLVLRMVKQTGCRVLLSEDMQHGQEFDGMRIMNPFL